MTDAAPENTARPPPTVFLSYATEDRPAARSIREALQGLGVEVWYDESALDGGDAWDQKIRRQIRACDFFMPVISAQTAARPEGYFRREWRLAVERTLDMADDHLFLLPVIIDDTSEAGARVPEKFLAVQWTRVPGGRSNAALEGLARRVVSGQAPAPKSPTPTRPAPPRTGGRGPKGGEPPPAAPGLPEFPRQEPGQKIRFLFQVLGWTLQSGWTFFRRFPRWIRIIVYLWVAVLILSGRSCIPSSEEHHSEKLSRADPAAIAGQVEAQVPDLEDD
ncbi:MAG TPA: TIR domain-containing protein [Steroidobacteraceae bacterium]|nr:TIR domain-containing protein [Steroidobacteraceae bacterium]